MLRLLVKSLFKLLIGIVVYALPAYANDRSSAEGVKGYIVKHIGQPNPQLKVFNLSGNIKFDGSKLDIGFSSKVLFCTGKYNYRYNIKAFSIPLHCSDGTMHYVSISYSTQISKNGSPMGSGVLPLHNGFSGFLILGPPSEPTLN